MKKSKKILKLLTSAALMLPGIQNANAESPPDYIRAEFSYSTYDESGPRYNINIYQSRIEAPVTEKTSITVTTQRDMQTGASVFLYRPQSVVYTGDIPNPGNPAIINPVTSGASISEVRDSISVTGYYYFPESIAGLGYRYSTENDYLSNSVDFSLRKLFNKKNTELLMGGNYSHDRVSPVWQQNYIPPRNTIICEGSKNTITAVFGLRQDLSQKTVVSLAASYKLDRGYLADPYRYVMIYGDATSYRPGSYFFEDPLFGIFPTNLPGGLTIDNERRPGKRETTCLVSEIVRYIEKFGSSFSAEYKFTYNTWGIKSNQLELTYYQPFSGTWQIAPMVRYYTQTAASFYSQIFTVLDNPPFVADFLPIPLESSSDYRLGRFGTMNYQLALTKNFPLGIDLTFVGGLYTSREWLRLGPPPAVTNPTANYSITYFSVLLGVNFD